MHTLHIAGTSLGGALAQNLAFLILLLDASPHELELLDLAAACLEENSDKIDTIAASEAERTLIANLLNEMPLGGGRSDKAILEDLKNYINYFKQLISKLQCTGLASLVEVLRHMDIEVHASNSPGIPRALTLAGHL